MKTNLTQKFKKEIDSSYKEIKNQFKFDLKKFKVEILPTRQAYEKRVKKKTSSWQVGCTLNGDTVVMLSPFVWEKEDFNSHRKSDFVLILKHELTHLFIRQLAGTKVLPVWLNEGLSGYFSGQYKDKMYQKNLFIETDFTKILDTPFKWEGMVKYGAYALAYQFVAFLCEKHGFNKIKKLITEMKRNYEYEGFNNKFEKVFGKNLKSMEREFIRFLN